MIQMNLFTKQTHGYQRGKGVCVGDKLGVWD